ncbi:MAG: hypothetical protein V4482_05035 [Pseudomonadota bacterium]
MNKMYAAEAAPLLFSEADQLRLTAQLAFTKKSLDVFTLKYNGTENPLKAALELSKKRYNEISTTTRMLEHLRIYESTNDILKRTLKLTTTTPGNEQDHTNKQNAYLTELYITLSIHAVLGCSALSAEATHLLEIIFLLQKYFLSSTTAETTHSFAAAKYYTSCLFLETDSQFYFDQTKTNVFGLDDFVKRHAEIAEIGKESKAKQQILLEKASADKFKIVLDIMLDINEGVEISAQRKVMVAHITDYFTRIKTLIINLVTNVQNYIPELEALKEQALTIKAEQSVPARLLARSFNNGFERIEERLLSLEYSFVPEAQKKLSIAVYKKILAFKELLSSAITHEDREKIIDLIAILAAAHCLLPDNLSELDAKHDISNKLGIKTTLAAEYFKNCLVYDHTTHSNSR